MCRSWWTPPSRPAPLVPTDLVGTWSGELNRKVGADDDYEVTTSADRFTIGTKGGSLTFSGGAARLLTTKRLRLLRPSSHDSLSFEDEAVSVTLSLRGGTLTLSAVVDRRGGGVFNGSYRRE